MKKLLAILLALLMVAPLAIVSSATVMDYTKSFSVYTGDSSSYYSSNGEISLVLALRNVDFGDDDGISALELEIYYDKNRLTPLATAAEDSDGDSGDFTSLMTTNPGAWEGFGVVDIASGCYSLAFSDIMGGALVTEDDELVITVPFKVKSDAVIKDMVFNFDNVVAYNKNMETMAEIDLKSVIVKYSAQPAVLVNLPSDAIGLQVAGYRNDINNMVYYAKDAITVGGFVRDYCEITANQDKMSSFAIAIVDLNGCVTYVDTDISADSDKASVMIPASYYIIAICSANTEDYQKFVNEVSVGKRISLYNVNIEGAGIDSTAVDLVNAGFVVSNASENKDPFIGGDQPITPAPEPMPEPEPEILIGDVNGNGAIDSLDYVFIKRAYFGKYEVSNIKVADINKNGTIDSLDYLFIKRAYFGRYEI